MKRLTSLFHCSRATARMIVSQKHYRGTVYIARSTMKGKNLKIYETSHTTTLLLEVPVRMTVSQKHYYSTIYIAKRSTYNILIIHR